MAVSKLEVCLVLFFVFGILFILLAVNFDSLIHQSAGSIGRSFIEKVFQGTCTREELEAWQMWRAFSEHDDNRRRRATVPQVPYLSYLSGAQVGVYLHPFQWQGLAPTQGNDTPLFEEVGVISLKLTVYNNSLWVTQELDMSSMSMEDNFFNVNLLDAILAMLSVNHIPSDAPLPYGSSLINTSLHHRISNIMEYILLLPDTYVDQILKADDGWALVINADGLKKERRRRPFTLKLDSGFPALVGRSSSYRLPGLNHVTWRYWRTGPSAMGGLWVDQYFLEDVWTRELLCRLSVHGLLHATEAFKVVGITLSPPATRHLPVITNISVMSERAGILDVYPPLALPVGGSLAAQINVQVPPKPQFGSLGNLTVPYMWMNLTVEALPEVTVTAIRKAINVRSTLIITLGVLGTLLVLCSLLVLLRTLYWSHLLNLATCRRLRNPV